MNTAHRTYVSEQNSFPDGDTHPNSVEDQLDASNEKWAELSVELRNRVQVGFNSDELEVIDRFILLASQRSIFNKVGR